MENTPGLRYIWSAFRPLLQGKVLYTPDTPAARLLIKEVRSGQEVEPPRSTRHSDAAQAENDSGAGAANPSVSAKPRCRTSTDSDRK